MTVSNFKTLIIISTTLLKQKYHLMINQCLENSAENIQSSSVVCSTKSFENTVGKGEIAYNEQFLSFLQCFLHVWRTSGHFHQICKCRLQTL